MKINKWVNSSIHSSYPFPPQSFINLSIHPLNDPSIRPSSYSSIHLFNYTLIHPCIHSAIPPPIIWLARSFIQPFLPHMHLFIHSFIHSLIPLGINSFTDSFIL
jgi:hypothetical protein